MKKKASTAPVRSTRKAKGGSSDAITGPAPTPPESATRESGKASKSEKAKKAKKSATTSPEATVAPAVVTPVILPGKSAKKNTATRYTPEEKAEIVAFVRDFDAAKGRGGKSAAVRKYGVSAISLSKWMDASPAKGKEALDQSNDANAPRRGRPRKSAKATKAGRPDDSNVGEIEATLIRMMQIQDLIADLQDEFDDLKETL